MLLVDEVHQVADRGVTLGARERKVPALVLQGGAGFPANEKAQATWTAYWSDKGVDTSVMAKTPSGTIMAPFGAKLGAAMDAYNGVLKEVFLGRTGVHEGVQAAQDAANAAIDQ